MTLELTDASNVHTELTAVEKAIRSEVVQFVCVSRQGAMWMPILAGLAQWQAKSFTSPGRGVSLMLVNRDKGGRGVGDLQPSSDRASFVQDWTQEGMVV